MFKISSAFKFDPSNSAKLLLAIPVIQLVALIVLTALGYNCSDQSLRNTIDLQIIKDLSSTLQATETQLRKQKPYEEEARQWSHYRNLIQWHLSSLTDFENTKTPAGEAHQNEQVLEAVNQLVLLIQQLDRIHTLTETIEENMAAFYRYQNTLKEVEMTLARITQLERFAKLPTAQIIGLMNLALDLKELRLELGMNERFIFNPGQFQAHRDRINSQFDDLILGDHKLDNLLLRRSLADAKSRFNPPTLLQVKLTEHLALYKNEKQGLLRHVRELLNHIDEFAELEQDPWRSILYGISWVVASMVAYLVAVFYLFIYRDKQRQHNNPLLKWREKHSSLGHQNVTHGLQTGSTSLLDEAIDGSQPAFEHVNSSPSSPVNTDQNVTTPKDLSESLAQLHQNTFKLYHLLETSHQILGYAHHQKATKQPLINHLNQYHMLLLQWPKSVIDNNPQQLKALTDTSLRLHKTLKSLIAKHSTTETSCVELPTDLVERLIKNHQLMKQQLDQIEKSLTEYDCDSPNSSLIEDFTYATGT